MVKAGWNAQAFEVFVDFNGTRAKRPIAGWVKGVWALDFRVFDLSGGWDADLAGGWLLNHLPTGTRVFGIIAPLDEAMQIADAINAMGEWDFEGPKPPKSLTGIRKKVEDRFGDKIAHSTLFCRGPLQHYHEDDAA